MFEITDEPDHQRFAIGDKVICINDRDIQLFVHSSLKRGEIYTVKGYSEVGSVNLVEIDGGYFQHRFKKCSR